MCISAGVGALLAGTIGAGASLAAASSQRSAMNRAADINQQYLDWEKQRYYEELERRRPFYELSIASLEGLRDFIEGDFDITTTKEYQIQSEALDRELAKHLSARGLQQSGFGVEESARLKTGLMSNLYNQRYSRLAGLAGLANLGFVNAPNLGSAYSNLANIAMAQGQMQAQNWQGLGQLPFNIINAYTMWNYLNRGTT